MVTILNYQEFLTESADQIRDFNQKVIDNVKSVMGNYQLEVADIEKTTDYVMQVFQKNTNKITDATLLDALSKTVPGDISGKIVTDVFK